MVELLSRAPVIARYPFTWERNVIDVTTHFFAARLLHTQAQPAPVHDASYLEGTHWIALRDVAQQLGFDTTILAAVEQLIRSDMDT